jgi:hypothetical protein
LAIIKVRDVNAKLAPALAAGFALPIAGGQNAHAAHTNCTGSVTGTSIDGDVFVARGAKGTLTEVIVDGIVLVRKAATLVVNGETVAGSVHASNCVFAKFFVSSDVVPTVNGTVHISPLRLGSAWGLAGPKNNTGGRGTICHRKSRVSIVSL